MSEHIEIESGYRLAGKLRQAIDNLSAAVSQLSQTRDVMETVASGGDYAAVEKVFGLPAGTGETVYNLVMASYKLTTYSEISQLITRLG